MSNIKINYTNSLGKRTSTTINKNIATHFYYTTDDNKSFDKIPSDYNERIQREVQKFVNEMSYQGDKNHIETRLLFETVNRNVDRVLFYKED